MNEIRVILMYLSLSQSQSSLSDPIGGGSRLESIVISQLEGIYSQIEDVFQCVKSDSNNSQIHQATDYVTSRLNFEIRKFKFSNSSKSILESSMIQFIRRLIRMNKTFYEREIETRQLTADLWTGTFEDGEIESRPPLLRRRTDQRLIFIFSHLENNSENIVASMAHLIECYLEICTQWVWHSKFSTNLEEECFSLISPPHLSSATSLPIYDYLIKTVLPCNSKINPFSILCHFPKLSSKIFEHFPTSFFERIKMEHVTQRILTQDEMGIFELYSIHFVKSDWLVKILMRLSKSSHFKKSSSSSSNQLSSSFSPCLVTSQDANCCSRTAECAFNFLLSLSKIQNFEISKNIS